MPGTFIIKPIEANLTHNTDLLSKMSPYCEVTVGGSKIKGQICTKGGKNPHWNDAITIPATHQTQVVLELMDKDKITRDDNIGSLLLDLQEVQASGQVSKWYPLTYKNKPAGEILLQTMYQPDAMGMQGQGQQYQGQQYGQNQFYGQEQMHSTHTGVSAEMPTRSHVFTEQRQVVEPHTFIKEVEVVETRSSMKDIEVMEPVKVLKDVQYTQAVPVTKQIEVMEPQVMRKDVEVMEPRLVTKTIQVVENVPVKRMVEVIEMRNTVQEVETMEPQTFTKQIEVTEYVPVKKQVEVTQPVTLKKAVEFVENVITTQTITKQMQEAVIIDEQITTTVGPASVIGISQEYGYIQNWGEISLTERERIGAHQRWTGYEHVFLGLNDQERLFEQQRLSRLNEQQWLNERARLLALNEQQRLLEQRNTYKNYYATHKGGFSSGQYSTGHQSQGVLGKQNPLC